MRSPETSTGWHTHGGKAALGGQQELRAQTGQGCLAHGPLRGCNHHSPTTHRPPRGSLLSGVAAGTLSTGTCSGPLLGSAEAGGSWGS